MLWIHCDRQYKEGRWYGKTGYEVRYQGIIELQPYEFWKRCEDEVDSNLLPVTVTLHEVVEIDDGLKPAFFYKTRSGYKIACAFKPTQQKA